jgi:putative ABC transport system ATP-binding protein
MVEMRALTKRYHEGNETRLVVRQADAEIHRGEFVALAGPSGSGKTTLLNLISGIDTPTSGEALIDATPVTRLSEKERTLFRRKNIGFVFQFFNLIPTLSVRENLLLPLQLNSFPAGKSQKRISELLEQVEMADRLGSYPDRLSGGEKQRVAIARALVHDPPLVLADEPTGNLDADTGTAIMSLLKSLIEGSGKTMIVVSHSDMVVRMADRVLAMEDGRLVERAE